MSSIDKQSFFMSLCRCFGILVVSLLFQGCGGTSNTNRFQQIAEARAARNRAEKAEKKEEPAKDKTVLVKPAELPSKENSETTPDPLPKVAETPVESVADRSVQNSPAQNNTVQNSSVEERSAQKTSMLISPNAAKLAVLDGDAIVAVHDVGSQSLIRRIYNPHLSPFCMAISDEGDHMVVGGINGGFKTFSLASITGFDRFQQNRLRRNDYSPPHQACDGVVTAVAIDKSSDLVATGGDDGLLKLWQANTGRLISELNVGDDAITSLAFHADGKRLFSGDVRGKVSLRNCPELNEAPVHFGVTDAAVKKLVLAPSGQHFAVIHDSPKDSVKVWSIQSDADHVEPTLTIGNEASASSVAFTSDSEFLLIGYSDGAVRVWNIAKDHEVASMKAHKGAVVDVSSGQQPGEFITVGVDRSLSTWQLPSSLPSGGGTVLISKKANRQKVKEASIPKNVEDVLKEEPLDAARQALISGASSDNVLDLMGVAGNMKEMAQSAIAAVMESEKDGLMSGGERSRRRRQLTRVQEEFSAKSDRSRLSSFADGFSNLSFVGSSNFKFGLEKTSRPVQLLFSDQFLYAALASKGKKKSKRQDDQAEIDEGDNGALLSWDYKFSRLQTHAWSIEDLNVSQLVALPDSAGVLTVPQMMLFSKNGSSRSLGNVASWSVREQSNSSDSTGHLLAVGSESKIREESDVLKIFNTNDLSENRLQPFSRYRSYEGVVTAMAFANNSSSIAFSVRERAVHRLFIADASTLTLRKLEEVNHPDPWLQEGNEGEVANRNSGAAIGISTLAFSPDDEVLVAHGQYPKSMHKFSQWDLDWDGTQFVNFRKSRKELTSEQGPFFDDSGNQPITFISRPIRENERDPDDVHWQSKRTGGRSPKIVVRNRKGIQVVNLNSARAERMIPYPDTHDGTPQYDISDDGRWLAMGDDNGKAWIYDLDQGDTYGVTIDSAMETMIANPKQARPEISNRPAHLGPVVGIAFSKPDLGRDYPAFLATFGEENKVKVWELYPVLDPDHGLRSRHWVSRIKSLLRQSSKRRRTR